MAVVSKISDVDVVRLMAAPNEPSTMTMEFVSSMGRRRRSSVQLKAAPTKPGKEEFATCMGRRMKRRERRMVMMREQTRSVNPK